MIKIVINVLEKCFIMITGLLPNLYSLNLKSLIWAALKIDLL